MSAPKRNSYLRLPEGTTWPDPKDPNEIQHTLRYGQPSREDLLVAASFIAAYGHLLAMPTRRRAEVVTQIRRSADGGTPQ
jgi:hypothetical protein